MEFTVEEKMELYSFSILNMELYFTIGTCIPFIIGFFTGPLIVDRRSQMKDVHHGSGISVGMYWIVNFCWDYITYCIICTVFFIPLACLKLEGVLLREFCAMYLIILVFGLYALPFDYCLSLFISDATVGYITSVAFCIATGTYNLLINISLLNRSHHYAHIMMVFAPFSLLRGIRNIHLIGLINGYCKDESEYLNIPNNIVCNMTDNDDLCCGEYYQNILFGCLTAPII